MHYRPSYLLLLLLLVPLGGIRAQETVPSPWERPDLWLHVQDDKYIFRYSGDDTLSNVAPSYTFGMASDSTCRSFYRFTEAKVNSRTVRLLHWKYDRVAYAEPHYLNYNSRTDNFFVRSGDTISFYREWEWMNPLNNYRTLDNYKCLDTLAYAVYLVRTRDSQCVALLDSMTIMPSPLHGTPRIHATRPIMALVRFIVPPEMNGDSMFIGVAADAQGPGPYHFTRRDAYTINRSGALQMSSVIEYLQAMGNVMGRRPVEELSSMVDAASTALDVAFAGEASNEVVITIRDATGTFSLIIYDAEGRPVAYPSPTARAGNEQTARFRFTENGVYFVALQNRERVVTTRKLIITQ